MGSPSGVPRIWSTRNAHAVKMDRINNEGNNEENTRKSVSS
jgi:hypothetical protein